MLIYVVRAFSSLTFNSNSSFTTDVSICVRIKLKRFLFFAIRNMYMDCNYYFSDHIFFSKFQKERTHSEFVCVDFNL